MREWEISVGTYPGIMLGFRTYNEVKITNHVLYVPFIDVCLTLHK